MNDPLHLADRGTAVDADGDKPLRKLPLLAQDDPDSWQARLEACPVADGPASAGFIRPDGVHVGFPEGIENHSRALRGAVNLMAAVRAGVIRYRPWAKRTDLEIAATPNAQQRETLKRLMEARDKPVVAELSAVLDGQHKSKVIKGDGKQADQLVDEIQKFFAGPTE
jgi:hypothetical protein